MVLLLSLWLFARFRQREKKNRHREYVYIVEKRVSYFLSLLISNCVHQMNAIHVLPIRKKKFEHNGRKDAFSKQLIWRWFWAGIHERFLLLVTLVFFLCSIFHYFTRFEFRTSQIHLDHSHLDNVCVLLFVDFYAIHLFVLSFLLCVCVCIFLPLPILALPSLLHEREREREKTFAPLKC